MAVGKVAAWEAASVVARVGVARGVGLEVERAVVLDGVQAEHQFSPGPPVDDARAKEQFCPVGPAGGATAEEGALEESEGPPQAR